MEKKTLKFQQFRKLIEQKCYDKNACGSRNEPITQEYGKLRG